MLDVRDYVYPLYYYYFFIVISYVGFDINKEYPWCSMLNFLE